MNLYVGLYGNDAPGCSAAEALSWASAELGVPAESLRVYRLRRLTPGALLGLLGTPHEPNRGGSSGEGRDPSVGAAGSRAPGAGQALCALVPARSGSLTMGLFTFVSQQSQRLRQLQRRGPRGEEDVREALRIAQALLTVVEEVQHARDAAVAALEELQGQIARRAARGGGERALRGLERGEDRDAAALPRAVLAAEAGMQLRAEALGTALRLGRGAGAREALAERIREMCEEFGVE